MSLTPKTPYFKQKIEASFNRQGFMEYIDAELIDVQPGYCEIHIPYQKEQKNMRCFTNYFNGIKKHC